MAILGLDINPFEHNLERAKSHAHSAGNQIKESWGNVLSEKIVQFASAAAVEEVIRQTIEWGEHVYDLSRRLGMGTDEVQQWDFALKQNGSSIERAVGFFEKLAVAREKLLRGGKGSEQIAQEFGVFGISKDEVGKMRVGEIGKRMAEAFERPDINPDKLTAAMRILGGKAANELAPAFRAGLADLLNEAPVVKDDDIYQLKEAGDQIKQIFMEVRAGVAPVIAFLTSVVSTVFHSLVYSATFVVGAVAKAGEQMKNAITHPLDFIKSLKDDPSKIFKEVYQSGADAATFYANTVAKHEIEAKNRRDRSKASFGVVPDDETNPTTKELKAQEEIKKIMQQVAEIRERSHMSELTAIGKIHRLKKELAALDKERPASELDMAKQEKRRAELEEKLRQAEKDRDKELDQDEKEKAKEDKHRAAMLKPDLNALQRIGGMFVHQREETQTALIKSIENHVKQMSGRGAHKTAWEHSKHS